VFLFVGEHHEEFVDGFQFFGEYNHPLPYFEIARGVVVGGFVFGKLPEEFRGIQQPVVQDDVALGAKKVATNAGDVAPPQGDAATGGEFFGQVGVFLDGLLCLFFEFDQLE
jgi:hypothetical protein